MAWRLSRHERGYDYKHTKRRKSWVARVKTGTVPCARCGLPILPGQPWDLGHDDFDRTRYNGPEHALKKHCPAGGNRRAGGRVGAAITNGRRRRKTSRVW